MDVLVKVVQYLGIWLLNQAYSIVTVSTVQGDQVIIVPTVDLKDGTVWLLVADSKDYRSVYVEEAQSLQKETVALAKPVNLYLSANALVEENPTSTERGIP